MEKPARHIQDEFKEMQYQFEVVAGKIEEVAVVEYMVKDISGEMDKLQRTIQQTIKNNNPAAAAVASNADGPNRSTRERQMQNLEIGNDVARWKTLGPQRH